MLATKADICYCTVHVIEGIFKKYAKRFEDFTEFGIRKFLIYPDIKIYALPRPFHIFYASLIVTRETPEHEWDCFQAAYAVAYELKSKGFDARVMETTYGNVSQAFVSAYDPTEGRWLNVDVSPWFSSTDCHHKGSEHVNSPITPHRKTKAIRIDEKTRFLSTKRLREMVFTDTYLGGIYNGGLIVSDKKWQMKMGMIGNIVLSFIPMRQLAGQVSDMVKAILKSMSSKPEKLRK